MAKRKYGVIITMINSCISNKSSLPFGLFAPLPCTLQQRFPTKIPRIEYIPTAMRHFKNTHIFYT